MKYFVYLCVFIVAILPLWSNSSIGSQNPIAPVSMRSARESPHEILLNTYAVHIADSTQKLTLQNLRQEPSLLRPLHNGLVNFGISTSAHWFAFSLTNTDTLPQTRLLVVEDYFLETIDTYIIHSSGTEERFQGGCTIPFDERRIKNRFTAHRLTLLPNDTVQVFMRVLCRLTMSVPIKLWQMEAFNLADNRAQVPIWLYYGIVLGLFAYNLFICITLRSGTYALYLVYVAHISAFMFWGNNGLGFEYFRLPVDFVLRLIMYLGMMSMMFVGLLTMRFLETGTALTRWHRVMQAGAAVLLVLSLGAWFLPMDIMQKLGNPATGAMAVLCAAVAVRSLWREYLPAWYFAAGWVLFLTATVLFVLQNDGLIDSSAVAQYGAQFGSAVEMVMFSMALASRMSVLEKEREQAREELLHTSKALIESLQQSERTLEQKVEERTTKLQAMNDRLSEANEEVQRQIFVSMAQSREITLANATLQEQYLVLEESRHHIERLMLNILPKPIAMRLQAGEKSIADRFESVTVLFADIAGFTEISANISSPEELVALLDTLFSRFDALAERYNVEKIKTIGDAYMVVGGLPESAPNHLHVMALLALDMQATVIEMAEWLGLPELSMRIGMHTGAVVAGVIGTKKFAYDLWGDTVNTASRMESHGEAGKIHVSEEVYEALKDEFLFEERGEIDVKGKGVMRTWYLVNKKT